MQGKRILNIFSSICTKRMKTVSGCQQNTPETESKQTEPYAIEEIQVEDDLSLALSKR